MSGAYCDGCGYNMLNGDCTCPERAGIKAAVLERRVSDIERRMMSEAPEFSHSSGEWPRPVPVSERLPEVGERVLWLQDGDWEPGRFEGSWGMDMDDFNIKATDHHYMPDCEDYGGVTIERDRVTHWMPMPPTP